MPSWCRFLTVLAAVLHLSEPACAAPGASPACTLTWNGQVVAGKLDKGVCKTTVRYGSAKRWEDSVAATSQSGISATEAPPACPQAFTSSLGGPSQSEDCLTATIYAPVGARRLPVFVWLHGGSYSIGASSNFGLDGTEMAKKGKVMVVVLQYRLNILGLIPPPVAPSASDPNLQVRDVILGLKEIKKNLGWQGDMGKVTVGGQSTGASLIRGEYSWSPSLARPADASIVGRPRGPRPVPADDSPV
jgi:carboxylesterase type B